MLQHPPQRFPPDAEFEQRIRENFNRQTFMALIGASLESVVAGACVIRANIRSDLCQQHGYVHAGVTSAIADTAAGYAASSLFPKRSNVLTIEFKINFLSPARGRALVARAGVIRSGKTISIVQSDVFAQNNGEEKHIAAMQATMLCANES